MWGSTTSWKDESDGEFVVWHVRAESDDGRIQTVRIKIDAGAVKFEEGPVGGRVPAEVRETIETRGKSVIETVGTEWISPSRIYLSTRVRRIHRGVNRPLFPLFSGHPHD
jgi:hypothetical protein